MHAPALKLALALPTLLLPSAVRRDTAYPPLAERVVTRHRILASTKPRQKAQLFGAHIAPVIAPTSGTAKAPKQHLGAQPQGLTLPFIRAPLNTVTEDGHPRAYIRSAPSVMYGTLHRPLQHPIKPALTRPITLPQRWPTAVRSTHTHGWPTCTRPRNIHKRPMRT